MNINYLIIAGFLSVSAAFMHLGIILGGPRWYRFFGAGENMARMAERNSIKPILITSGIASVLLIWGMYAFAGAGLSEHLPFQKFILIGITFVYLLRGMFGLYLIFSPIGKIAQDNSPKFWLWSSLVCLLFGLVHLKGVVDNWLIL